MDIFQNMGKSMNTPQQDQDSVNYVYAQKFIPHAVTVNGILDYARPLTQFSKAGLIISIMLIFAKHDLISNSPTLLLV